MAWQLNPYAIPFILSTVPLGYCIKTAWRGRASLPERLFLALTGILLWLLTLFTLRLVTTDARLMVWLAVFYVNLILFASTGLIMRRLGRAPAIFRQPSHALLMASILPWGATVVDLPRLNPLPMLDASVFCLVISISVLAWSLFRLRLLYLAPAAHDMVVRSLSDAVFVVDTQQRIVEANSAAARLMHTSERALIGQPAVLLCSALNDKLHEYLQAQDVSEEIVCRSQGEPRYLDLRISPLRNPWGAEQGRIVIIRDITEQRRAEQQSAQLTLEQEKVKLLHEFLNVTSHDLNTPLTTLRISTDLLRVYTNRIPGHMAKVRAQAGPLIPEGTITDLDKLMQSIIVNGSRISDSTTRLQRLVGDMLELVRLDKQLQLEVAEECLNDVGEEVLAQLRTVAAEKALVLTFQPDTQLPRVRFDVGQLEMALKHLMRNAITYSPDGGAIILRTYRRKGWVVAEVSDSGVGIPADDLPHIFERFYRIDKARNSQTGGMGLGLAITRKIMDAHQGRVEVESMPGGGSTFRLCLPVMVPAN